MSLLIKNMDNLYGDSDKYTEESSISKSKAYFKDEFPIENKKVTL